MSDRYYQIHQMAEDVYHIYEPGGVGSTLILGKCQALLIDTGYGFSDIRKVIRSLTNLPVQVVNTHGHTDHTGGNYLFKRVWMNPADRSIYKAYNTNQKPLIAAKFQAECKAAGKKNIWPEDFDRIEWYNSKTREFDWLINGQTFDLDSPKERCNQTFDFDMPSRENHLIQTIFMPGHTGGSTMFFDWKNYILFSGDDLDYSLWLMFDNSAPLYTYQKHLRILKNYPIEWILPSHRTKMLDPWIIRRLDEAITHLSVENSRIFFHPRTGVPAMLYKEPLNGGSPDGLDTIYIVYRKNHM